MTPFLGLTESEWLGAVTLTISIVALIVTLWKNVFGPWIYHPSIVMGYGTRGEFLSHQPPVQGGDPIYSWYRLRIGNQRKWNSVSAKNVYVKLYQIYRYKDPIQPFNPLKLTYVSGHETGQYVQEESLARGEHDYVNLCTLVSSKSTNDTLLYPSIPGRGIAAGIDEKSTFSPGVFGYYLAVHGENVKSAYFELEIRFSKSDGANYIDIKEVRGWRPNHMRKYVVPLTRREFR